MAKSLGVTILVLLVLLLTACSPQAMLEKMAGAENPKIARDYLQRLKAGDIDKLTAELDPKLQTPEAATQFKKMLAAIPPGEPTSVELVGFQSRHFPGESTYNVTFQFDYSGKWVVMNAAWREKPGEPRQIVGMQVVPIPQSLQETNAFTFQRAGAAHYVFLTAAIANVAFILVTLIACIRTRFPRRKWLWILFVLVGFVQFSLNWTTGAFDIRPLYVQLFGASAMAAGPYSPWILSVSLPVGAVIFWFKRRKLAAADAAPPPVLTA